MAAHVRARRVLFVNSGILGHRAVAGLLKDATARIPSIDATHIDLGDGLSIGDRIVRYLFSVRLMPTTGPFGNLDLRRWRQEMNVGLLAARRVAAAERHGAFELLHFHTQATAYASLARMKRTPAIVSLDATQRQASLQAVSRLGRWTYTPNIVHDGHVFGAARAIVATSRWAGDDLAALYPDCAHKLHMMPYPVKLSGCEPSWIEERAARTIATPLPPVRVLFVGGDFPRKGGNDLLAAWTAGGFAERATLDLVTDWPLAANRLPPGVRVVKGVAPYTRDWFEMWRRADLFVMPTRHEAFGMVYQEAAAAGLPSIATNINAIPEIVQDGRTGMLVPPGDADGLRRAIGRLVDSPELRREMGTAARSWAERFAAPEAYAARLGAIIGDVMAGQRS
jgi:glycosyltransferase involved in cell wall biosynthesis